MDNGIYSQLIESYAREYGFPVFAVDARGEVVFGSIPHSDCSCGNRSADARIRAAEQTMAFGDPVISLCCENGYAMWAIPMMVNAQLTGALVVQGVDLESGEEGIYQRVREASQGLLKTAIAANLTNEAALQQARRKAQRESEKFLVIEASKEGWARDDLRSTYLHEEPGLLTAIKEGRIKDARSILNIILVSIYSAAEHNTDLLKSCILELVVMMSRAAVEAGANPSVLLGNNYRFITDLAAITDEEDLAAWVRDMLEALISSIQKSEAYPHFMVLNKALAYMETHLHEPIKRDEVAKHVGMSPSHFSKIMMDRLGRSFSELLNQYRINRAKQLIATTDYNLTAVAMECGFFDQSHFSRTFRKSTGMTPKDFRTMHL
ncbi:MAG: helix-turn-helix domain-containing protein [Puniceicoccaceae bacterium]